MALKLPASCSAVMVSYGTPSDGPSKAAARLLLQLRRPDASLSSPAVRRSLHGLPRHTLLDTLRHLLHQHDWQLALPMYLSLTETSWFSWNAELHAELVALLTSSQQIEQVESLLEGLEEKLSLKEEMNFNRALIQMYSKFGLKEKMLASFERLQALTPPNSTAHSPRYLVHAYASMNLPHEALTILRKMQQKGVKPSMAEFKAILFSFGKCGMFTDMEAVACHMEKLNLLDDPVVINMIITTYATAENHSKVEEWLRKMLGKGLQPSVRSANAAAKACRVLSSVSSSNIFVKAGALLEYLKSQGAEDGEVEVVKALLDICPVDEVFIWDPNWELDVHSASVASARVMLCHWLENVVKRLQNKQKAPSEIAIVTGWGKHSETRGTSLIKIAMRDLLESVDSPFKVDSQNKGRLLAKPHAVVAWFSQL